MAIIASHRAACIFCRRRSGRRTRDARQCAATTPRDRAPETRYQGQEQPRRDWRDPANADSTFLIDFRYFGIFRIHFMWWQAGHGNAKHPGRAGLLLRAPAPEGYAPPCRAGTARSRTANDEAYRD